MGNLKGQELKFNTQEVWWGWWFLVVIVIVYFVCSMMMMTPKTDLIPIHTTEAAPSPENYRMLGHQPGYVGNLLTTTVSSSCPPGQIQTCKCEKKVPLSYNKPSRSRLLDPDMDMQREKWSPPAHYSGDPSGHIIPEEVLRKEWEARQAEMLSEMLSEREHYASAEGGTDSDFTSPPPIWISLAPDIPISTSPPIWVSPSPDIPIFTSPPPAVEEPGCPSEIPGVYPDALDPEFRKCQAQKMAACYAKCHSIDPLYFLYNP